jgi:TnpA family transposase
MSTRDDERIDRVDKILTPRQRRTPILLPVDPTDEELALDWTLAEEDLVEVARCRGDKNRRRFSIQLSVLRLYGRFLDEYSAVPVRVINHLCRRIEVAPVLFVDRAVRDATESAQQQRIRAYLGYSDFDDEIRARLEQRLEEWTAEDLVPRDLFDRAEKLLRSWKVVLPSPSTLERLVVRTVARTKQEIYERLAAELTDDDRDRLDELLGIQPGDRRSLLFHLKRYPPEATPQQIAAHIRRYETARSIGSHRVEAAAVEPDVIRHLALVARKYDVDDLKRMGRDKRHAMLACFLAETRKTLLDQVVAMHDQYITGMIRRSTHDYDARHKDAGRRARKGLETIVSAVESLLEDGHEEKSARAIAFLELHEMALREAIVSVRTFQRLEDRGYVDTLCARYSKLREYFRFFVRLDFEGEPGSRALMEGLDIVRGLDSGEIKRLPDDAPQRFVPPAWKPALRRADGTIDRAVWEIALAIAVRDSLRSGDLYLSDSHRHVSFSNFIYDERHWTDARERSYVEMGLPTAPDDAVARLRSELTEAALLASAGLDENPFASIYNGRLKLKRSDALAIPASVRELRRALEGYLPRIRIEDLVADIDARCAFTQQLRPLGGYEPRSTNVYTTMLAALVAHATNLGIAAMGQSAEGITVDMLQHVTRWFLREETLKAANAAIIEYHHGLRHSSVFGLGTVSSSDGQRFGVQGSTLLGSFYPRYFGYYDRAITIYTHTSDQFTVFSTKAISCGPREAVYVLDGLLENDTVLRPHEHCSDMHGYTEHIFGLCYLLGFSFMPRLKDLKDQQLFRLDRHTSYGAIDAIIRATVNADVIREQWDQLVRLAASLRDRTAPANVVVGRLANSVDRLSKALTALGRIVKTIHILRYIHDDEVRNRIQLQLNRGEQRHQLARWLFFANQGEFRKGDFEEIMNKSSCLSLLSNAVVVWNTIQMQRIVDQLRAAGEVVSDRDLAHIAPLAFAHVIPNGTYHFERTPTANLPVY